MHKTRLIHVTVVIKILICKHCASKLRCQSHDHYIILTGFVKTVLLGTQFLIPNFDLKGWNGHKISSLSNISLNSYVTGITTTWMVTCIGRQYIYRKQGRFARLNFHVFYSFLLQKYFREYLFILYKVLIMALLKCFKCKGTAKVLPWKASLGGIHESLAQRIFPVYSSYGYVTTIGIYIYIYIYIYMSCMVAS